MAIIQSGVDSSLLTVDSSFKAARTSSYPPEVLGWNSVGALSGNLTGVAANGPVFSFRNISSNLLIVHKIGVGFICTTGFTTGQIVDYGLMVARSFSASDSGGTAIAFTGNNTKHRTSLATPTSMDCRISTTGALTAGTRTLDSNNLGQIGGFAATTTTGVVIAPTSNNLFAHDPGDHPLVLAQNEGFIIQNLTAMGAAGVGRLYVNLEFAEASSF
jgi:hypothetical protein